MLKAVAAAHEKWSLRYGDEVPYVAGDANPHDGQTTDLALHQADRSASPSIDDPLNAEFVRLVAQLDGPDPVAAAAPGFDPDDADDDDPDDGDEPLDFAESALAAAIEELRVENTGEVAASYNPRELRIPAGHVGGGRWRKTVDVLKELLREHGGSGDPFPGYDREKLRRVARDLHIPLVRGEVRDSIAAKLRRHLSGGESGPHVPSVPAKPAANKAAKPDLAAYLTSLADVTKLAGEVHADSLRDTLDLHTVLDLKPWLREAGLPVSGRKRELVDRLVEHVAPAAHAPAAPAAAKEAAAAKSFMSQMTPARRKIARELGVPDDHPLALLANEISQMRSEREIDDRIRDLKLDDVNQLGREVGVTFPPGTSVEQRRAHISRSLISYGISTPAAIPAAPAAAKRAVRKAAPKVPEPAGTAGHVAALEKMTSREEASAYLAGIKGAALADLAEQYKANFGTAAEKRQRILQSAVGTRLAFDAMRAQKAEPLKAPAPELPGDLTGAHGLSADPAVRAVQVENRIRQTYAELRGPDEWLGLAELRDRLGSDVSREEVDRVLTDMARNAPDVNSPDRVRIIPVANTKALTPADRAAAVRIGGEDSHAISFGDPSPRPLPGVAPEPKLSAAEHDALNTISSGAPSAVVAMVRQSTLARLERRGFVIHQAGHWELTDVGRQIFANAPQPTDFSAIAEGVARLPDEQSILDRLSGMTKTDLKKVAREFRIVIPSDMRSTEDIRRHIAQAVIRGRGRSTIR